MFHIMHFNHEDLQKKERILDRYLFTIDNQNWIRIEPNSNNVYCCCKFVFVIQGPNRAHVVFSILKKGVRLRFYYIHWNKHPCIKHETTATLFATAHFSVDILLTKWIFLSMHVLANVTYVIDGLCHQFCLKIGDGH